eukprot:CAMPEP_0197832120 /NCGR_PEP_ID=MMETSP1437-20131217/13395_1 /TAXON_ID=49252 ORGANISM="Eucampia antarctica, Strain CCMP1452" /NCGR_SAMPLE_ID=MMETSP1437 /ASSEMBLY_ACC=CAM_ASM_001096 /LENGTH=482 /DNA_ID=CAMNT_0043435323 /DNA_START=1 /DNA_END=1449 /DNA_ORIENTATION=+
MITNTPLTTNNVSIIIDDSQEQNLEEQQKKMNIENKSMNDAFDTENDATKCNPNVKSTSPFHREWLKDLLQKHKDDERLKPYRNLLSTYPILENKALVCAPMVDQSDLPFRLLCRRYNTNLCFTPMIHAKMFAQKPGYRKKFWDYMHSVQPEDRPLIAQLCGSDKGYLTQCIETIQDDVDGVDLNCGCPQSIAKRGNYGAFLLEKGDLLEEVVHHLVHVAKVKCPVSVKVRLLPTVDTLRGEGVESDIDQSLKLYTRLVEAGAAMLTIHGRNRFNKLHLTGRANWEAIRTVVDRLGHAIPIITNGNIASLDEVRECLEVTRADGVMSSEGLLEYPALFTETGTCTVENKRTGPGRLALTKEYIRLCQQYPPEKGGQGNGVKCVRAHIHRFLRPDLQEQPTVRDLVTYAQDYETFWEVIAKIEKHREENGHVIEDENLSWYMRHRIRKEKQIQPEAIESKRIELDEDAAACRTSLFGGEDEDY